LFQWERSALFIEMGNPEMLGFFLTTLATALSLLAVDLVVPGVDIANLSGAENSK
jgi:hypothetical protein